MLIAPATGYADERATVLHQLEAAGATLEHHLHPRRGPDGDELALDVGRLGAAPGEAHTVVVLSSGVHGVEGHVGSALQSQLLADGALARLPSGVAVLVVHAVNPYGMAWERRVDAANVDINRNWIDFDRPLPENPGYEDVYPIVNPTGPDLDLDDTSWVADGLAYGERVGFPAMFHAISGGQYRHPEGLQFGGQGPTWSRTVLEDVWRRHLAATDAVIHLDIHTGLGPCGVLTIFQTANADEPAAEAGAAWFPTVLRSDRAEGAEAVQIGVLGPGLDAAIPQVPLVVPVVLEWGTLDELTVLGAMRADNWLHHHGDVTGPVGDEVRSRMRAAFTSDDEGWRRIVGDQGTEHVGAALDAAAGRPGR